MHQLLEKLPPLSPQVPRETLEKLVLYSQWLMEWNQSINLSGAKTIEELFADQVLDCLAAGLSVPEHEVWIDVGTGAGLPGIVWALLFPQSQFYLVEAKEKKVSFLYRVVSGLKMENVKIINQRFESLKISDFNNLNNKDISCVSRGTAAPQDLLKLAQTSPIPWKYWHIFASEETSKEFLSKASSFDLKAKIISYPKIQSEFNSKTINSLGFLSLLYASGH